MNSPVMRSSTQKKPFFDACVITLRGLPLMFRSSSINCCTLSKSQLSLGVVWKCHLSWPVVRSTARMEHVYKLSRPCAPRNFCTHGSALPVPTYTRFASGSYAKPSHTAPPPPLVQKSPPQVLSADFIASFSGGSSGLPGTV